MSRLAPCADEVAGDDRLPVPRRERVRGAPEHRDEERDENDADAEVAASDQRLEPAAGRAGGLPALQLRGGAPGPCPARTRRAPRSRRAARRAGRPDRRGARRSRWSAGTSAASISAPPLATTTTSFQPSRRSKLRSRKTSVRPDDPSGAAKTASNLSVSSPPAPGRACTRCSSGVSATRRPSSSSTSRSATAAAKPGRANRRSLLVGGDLREVERVAHVDPVAGEDDLAVAVDGEVPERMGERRGRQDQGGERKHDGESLLHLTASFATGDQRGEKCGLMSSARAEAWRSAAAGAAEAALDHSAVEELERVAGAEPERAPRSGRAPPRSGRCGRAPRRGRPRPRCSGARRRLRARARGRRADVDVPVEVDERGLELGAGAVRLEEPLHDIDELVRLGRLGLAAGRGQGLAEAGRVLGQRHGVERAPVESDRFVDASSGGRDAGEAGVGAVVVRKAGERLAIRALGEAHSPAVDVEVAELDERPGGGLARRRGRRDGELHRRDRRRRCARAAPARTRRGRTRRRSASARPCGRRPRRRPCSRPVSTRASPRIAERRGRVRVDGERPLGQPAGLGEPVAGRGERGEAGQREVVVARRAASDAAERRLRAWVEAGVARLARALLVGEAEQSQPFRVLRVSADAALELLDLARQCRPPRTRRASAGGRDLGPDGRGRLRARAAREDPAEEGGRRRGAARPSRRGVVVFMSPCEGARGPPPHRRAPPSSSATAHPWRRGGRARSPGAARATYGNVVAERAVVRVDAVAEQVVRRAVGVAAAEAEALDRSDRRSARTRT